jgi:ribonuclease T2
MANRHLSPHRILALLVVSLSVNAFASVHAAGTFEAVRACDAFKSFAKGTNPGNIRLEPGQSYPIAELNERGGDWVRISVPAVRDPLRWVPMECGVTDFMQPEPRPGPVGRPVGRPGAGKCNTANTFDSHVLAMSWQPGFCEHARFSGRKPECDALADGELVISHLTIHGLWPNKQACGTQYGNCGATPLNLSEDTLAEVAPWMPNLMFETALATHEWSKHGSCQAREDDEYFRISKLLTEQVDHSVIGDFIRSNLGKEMSVSDFFAQVRRELGPDVEQKIQLLCTKGRFLQEIRLSLPRELVPGPDIAQLVAGAPRVRSRTDKCDSDKIFIERSGTE